jgi:uncharacterized protein
VLRQRLPLPVDDYTADTTPHTFVTAASYAAGVRRFGADKVARFAALVEKFGEPDLAPLSRRYQQPPSS